MLSTYRYFGSSKWSYRLKLINVNKIDLMQSHTNIDDDYEHMENVEYVLENILMSDDGSPEFKRLQDDYNSQLILSCNCTANKNTCNSIEFCCHGGGFEFNYEKCEFVLSQSNNIRTGAIVECNDLCKCQANRCQNRCVQFGPRKDLEVFESSLYKSKGLRTNVDIPCGAFICEYAGELLTLPEAQRRLKLIDRNGLMNYILCLYERAKSESSAAEEKTLRLTIIDPSKYGNIGRYLNHSCQPNCEILAVRTNCPIPKIGIFANRDIFANEELCFHYAGEESSETKSYGKPCLCAAPNCVGFIPNIQF